MALLTRVLLGLLSLQVACADAQVGDLQLRYASPDGAQKDLTGWAFASRDSSRFRDGVLVYGELHPDADTLGILELDLPLDPARDPVMRYQERRGREVVFEGRAVEGTVAVSLDVLAEEGGCSEVVDFALRFESNSGQQRSLDNGCASLEGGRCGSEGQLSASDGGVEVQLVDGCPTAPSPWSPPPAPGPDVQDEQAEEHTEPPPVVVFDDDDFRSGCELDNSYDEDPGCETSGDASTSSSGCADTTSDSDVGCEGDTTSSGSGCEGDDTDEVAACEGDTVAWVRPLGRRLPPGKLGARELNGLTVGLALFVPWWRGRRREREGR